LSARPRQPAPAPGNRQTAGGALPLALRYTHVSLPVTLLLTLLATTIAWHAAENALEASTRAHFEFRVTEITDAIRGRITDYAQVLRGGVALHAASESVEWYEWRAYVDTLRLENTYPGIQGIGIVHRVAHAHAGAFVTAMRRHSTAFGITPPGERPEYFAVRYIEPMNERNLRALGYDMYTEPVRRAAMERARDSGEAAVSGKVTLVQEGPTGTQPGFLVYLPLYANGAETGTQAQRQRALTGYVYAAFRMADLMRGLLGGVPDLRVEIFDGHEVSDEGRLYDSARDTARDEASFVTVSRVVVADHVWTVRTSALPALMASVDRTRPRVVLASGIAISLLVTALVWTLATTRARALRLAARMTRDLHQSREQLTMALEGSKLALFDWHVTEGTVALSESWNVMRGGPAQPTLTTIDRLEGTVHPEDAPRLRHHLAQVLRGAVPYYEIEHRVRTYDGRWKWIVSRAKVTERDENGRAVRLTGTNADITEKKVVEEMKDEFVATVSHELRTPLTSIIGGLALIKEDSATLPEETRVLLDLAYENAERLAALVNDILDIEKLEAGRIALEPKALELPALLRHALRVNAPYAERYGTRFELAEPVPPVRIWADEARVLQVLTNLLSNAARFSPADAPVTVRASEREGRTRVEIADRGPGVPDEFRSRIFTRFAQAHTGGNAPHGGTGLGLAISKAIVEASGGAIGFESAPGAGATFWFELPLAR